MCYDVALTARLDQILQAIPEAEVDPWLSNNYEPTDHVQAQAHRRHPIVLFEDNHYKLKAFEWGIIAAYMDNPEKIKKMRSSMCNARSEKIINDKSSYWHRLRHTRCLIPATGIFEHREVNGFKSKIPYYVTLKDRLLFYLPGLYHYPLKADVETGEITGNFTVVTRAANSLMALIHNSGDQAYRMPLFLPKAVELKWLQPGLSDDELGAILDHEIPSEALVSHPVYKIRNTAERPDGGLKTDAYQYADLPPLGQDGPLQGNLF